MKRLRILLCDDEAQMLSLLQSVLEPEYTVIGTAEDGQALIAAAQALRPDLVVTDIDMPRMDGIEAVQELRKTLPDCRVIFHTSRDEPEV
ncbi:MAG TPA: response regulator transcription factor, partial [Nitrospira sp.]